MKTKDRTYLFWMTVVLVNAMFLTAPDIETGWETLISTAVFVIGFFALLFGSPKRDRED